MNGTADTEAVSRLRKGKKVFVSYAHEKNETDKQFLVRVEELVNYLRAKGHIVVVDHDHAGTPPFKGWRKWMLEEVVGAHTVLIVCTPRLKEIYDSRWLWLKDAVDDAGLYFSVRGIAYECAIVMRLIRRSGGINSKFYPVLLDNGKDEYVPRALWPWWNCDRIFPRNQEKILKLVDDSPEPDMRTDYARSHSLRWTAALIVFLSLFIVLAMTVNSVRVKVKDRIVATIVQHNQRLAEAHAYIILTSLQRYAAKLEKTAADPGLKAILERGARAEKGEFFSRELARYANDVDADVLFFADTEGHIHGHSPEPFDRTLAERSFTFRDYYECALKQHDLGTRHACLSKVYIADPRGQGSGPRYTLSVPVYDGSGNWLGMLGAQRNIAPNMDDILRATRLEGADQSTILLGPPDALPEELVGNASARCITAPSGLSNVSKDVISNLIVVHQARLDPNQLCTIDARVSSDLQKRAVPSRKRNLQQEDTRAVLSHEVDYVDPLLESGITAFASVGSTGYFVAVFTNSRSISTMEDNEEIRGLIIQGGVLGVGLVFLLATAVVVVRDRFFYR